MSPRRTGGGSAAAALVAALLLAVPVAAASASPGESWPSFNESGGCDQPAGFHGPLATRTGYLPNTERVYGPFGDFFGRDIAEVRAGLVPWEVPMSGGKTVLVNRLALPAFLQVTENLAREQAAGRFYPVRPRETFGFTARTIGGRRAMSLHTFGIAVDINSRSNPYRGDNVLVTDMPDWFVQAWKDAGFCWGGDWQSVKDPMHFSWKGPAATPGVTSIPPPRVPRTGSADFSVTATLPVPWSIRPPRTPFLLDATRDGAADVYRLRPFAGGTLVEFIRSSASFALCSVGRSWSPAAFDAARMDLADFDGTSRADLWVWDDTSATLRFRVYLQRSGFTDSVDVVTSIPTSAGMEMIPTDYDADGNIDLMVVRPGSPTTVEVWAGPVFDTQLASTSAVSTGTWYTVGDRNVDGRPDLAVVADGTLTFDYAPLDGVADETVAVPIDRDSFAAVEMGDYDGDGRDDLFALRTSGVLEIRMGGVSDGRADLAGWFRDPAWECPDDEDLDELPSVLADALPRLGGSDRYGTAAAVSAAVFPDGAPVAFVASGDDFPDALAAGPVAAMLGGPVLLVNRDWVPAATAAELTRLAPSEIVVVGGTGVVSEQVESGLRSFADRVSRVAGLDRYGTAAALSELVAAPVETVYVATGENFPDALAAAPLVAADGAPLLLLSPAGVPASAAAALERLAPDRIVVLGGTGTVPTSVADELGRYASTVERIAGATRYDTAEAIADRLGSTGGTVLVATGDDFPDAVAASAAAAYLRAPVVLVRNDDVPAPSVRTLWSVSPHRIFVVGGQAGVRELVRGLLAEFVVS